MMYCSTSWLKVDEAVGDVVRMSCTVVHCYGCPAVSVRREVEV